MSEVMQPVVASEAIAALNAKVDMLTEQVAFLVEQARVGQQRRQALDELKRDMTPIVNDVFELSVEQLAEVEQYVQLEDILAFFKRLLRNTQTLDLMLDQLGSAQDLMQDAGPLLRDAFLQLVEDLDVLEQKGYFALLQEAKRLMDIVVANFTIEDMRRLGTNMETFLNVFKELTQPEVVTLVRNALNAYSEGVEQPALLNTSTWGLLKQMRDPEVQRGIAMTLRILRTVGKTQA